MMTDLMKLTVFAYLVAVGLCQEIKPLAQPDWSEFAVIADDPDSNYPSAASTVIRNEYICYGDPHCYQSVFANATGLGRDEICYSVNGDSGAWYNIWDHIVFGVEVDCHFNRPGPRPALYIDEVNIIANYRDVNVKLVSNTLVHTAGPVKPGALGSVTIIVVSSKEIVIKIDGNVYICLRAKVNKIFVYIRILRKVPKGALQGIMGAVENLTKAVIAGPTLVLEDSSTFPLGAEQRHDWYCRRPLPRTCYPFSPLSALIPDLDVYKLP